MDDKYQSCYELILHRAGERKIDLAHIKSFFEKKIKDLEAKYLDKDDYDDRWRLARAEYLVWERFFPTEPFPEVQVSEKPPPPQAKVSPPRKPKHSAGMEWVHDKYHPDAKMPLVVSDSRRGDSYTYSNRRVASKMKPRNGDHYSPPRKESSAAIKEKEPGSVKVTPQGPNMRPRMTAAEIATYDTQNPTRLSQDIKVEHKNIIPNSFQSPEILATMNAPADRSRFNPISYQMMGYSHRSTSGPGHRDLGKEHARDRQSGEPPEAVYFSQEKEMERRASRGGFRTQMFVYLQRARQQFRREHPNCTRFVRGYLSDKKTWKHFWPREKFPGVEPPTGHTQECLSNSDRLINAAALNRILPKPGTAPAHGRDGRLSPVSPLDFDPKVKLESHTGDTAFETTGAFTAKGVTEADPPGTVANAPQLLARLPSTPKPQVFKDPDEMWKKFKLAFYVSESDRRKIAKNVESQGELRLVFDKPSRQIVTVEELIKRTQYRYTLQSKLGDSKRKAETDDIDKERAQKRAATFLDNLNSM